MPRTPSVRAAVLATTFVVAMSVAAPSGAATVAAPRGATVIAVDANHHVSMPATIRPGVAHLRVSSLSYGGALVVRTKRHGLTTFLRYVNDQSPSSVATRKRLFDYVDYVAPGANVWVFLPRGTYFVIDGSSAAPVRRLDVRTIRVAGAPLDAARPRSTTLTQDSSVHLPASTTAGRTLRLVNRSTTQFMNVYVREIAGRATAAQVRRAVARPDFATVRRLSVISARPELLPTQVGPSHTAIVRTPSLLGRRYFVYTAYASQRGRLQHGELGLLTVR